MPSKIDFAFDMNTYCDNIIYIYIYIYIYNLYGFWMLNRAKWRPARGRY